MTPRVPLTRVSGLAPGCEVRRDGVYGDVVRHHPESRRLRTRRTRARRATGQSVMRWPYELGDDESTPQRQREIPRSPVSPAPEAQVSRPRCEPPPDPLAADLATSSGVSDERQRRHDDEQDGWQEVGHHADGPNHGQGGEDHLKTSSPRAHHLGTERTPWRWPFGQAVRAP
jgi:hypothetical protein